MNPESQFFQNLIIEPPHNRKLTRRNPKSTAKTANAHQNNQNQEEILAIKTQNESKESEAHHLHQELGHGGREA